MKPSNWRLKEERVLKHPKLAAQAQRDLQVQRAQEAQQMDADTDTDTDLEINQALKARLAAARLEINRKDLNLHGICISKDDMESIIAFLGDHPGVTSLNAYSVARSWKQAGSDCMTLLNGPKVYCMTDGGVFSVETFLTALQDNLTLTHLGFGFINNVISDTGVEALAAFLTANQRLTSVSLGDNNMGDPAALILSEALQSNVTLTELNLRPSQIGENGRAALKRVEDARNQAAQAASEQTKALVEENNGEPQALLHGFHRHLPVPSLRSLIASYNEMPRLTIKP